MKHLAALFLLLATSAAFGQTVKTLGYNTTNGHVVYSGTNALTFTNGLGFSTNAAAATRTNLGLGSASTNAADAFQPSSSALTNLADNNAANLTNFPTLNQNTTGTASNVTGVVAVANGGTGATNATDARNALGLGSGDTNRIEFNLLELGQGTTTTPSLTFATGTTNTFGIYGGGQVGFGPYLGFAVNGSRGLQIGTNAIRAWLPFSFAAGDAGPTTRTNLGLGLPALTNTSNVTMMRALAGSTNTNHPFSGTVSVVGTNNTNTLVFSNGILQEVQ